MAARKLSVSFEEDLADVIRDTAASEGVTVSAWLAEAAQDRVRNRLLGMALDAAELEDGPMSDDEMARLIATARQHSAVVTEQRSSAA